MAHIGEKGPQRHFPFRLILLLLWVNDRLGGARGVALCGMVSGVFLEFHY